ncbi:MAG: hypothetical protein Q9215_003321 [Flavoplaca cf. flavocitrina]
MFSPPSQSTASGPAECSAQAQTLVRGSNTTSPRSSAGSSASIADVEAGFLPNSSHRRQSSWKIALPFNIITKRVPSNDTESTTTDKSEREAKRYGWLSIILLVALLGVYVHLALNHTEFLPLTSNSTAGFLACEIPRHGTKPTHSSRSLASWATDSRDAKPIPCHSHNDYLRHVPLFDALTAGCTGVEADVWVDSNLKDDLYVGHTRKSLQPARTLNSLYIEPLLAILNEMNTPSNLSSPTSVEDPKTPAGVFETFPTQAITLLIDLKTATESTFPIVLAALKPLLERNYLTTWSQARGLVPGPIAVVGTGNTNFTSAILSPANSNPRLIFFDAPLDTLATLEHKDTNDYNTNNSYYASVSYNQDIGKPLLGFMYPSQVRKVKREIVAAGERGLVSRYWDAPTWPKKVERGIWDTLVSEGVGLLSVDDLEGVQGVWESGGPRSV